MAIHGWKNMNILIGKYMPILCPCILGGKNTLNRKNMTILYEGRQKSLLTTNKNEGWQSDKNLCLGHIIMCRLKVWLVKNGLCTVKNTWRQTQLNWINKYLPHNFKEMFSTFLYLGAVVRCIAGVWLPTSTLNLTYDP